MYYSTTYKSPIGKITIACDEKEKLVELWIEGQKYFIETIDEELVDRDELEVFELVKFWLDKYFRGDNPEISGLPLAPIGNAFRQRVWQILREIPYGEVCTYGDIYKKINLKQKHHTNIMTV